jgi:hypothetical protein
MKQKHAPDKIFLFFLPAAGRDFCKGVFKTPFLFKGKM